MSSEELEKIKEEINAEGLQGGDEDLYGVKGGKFGAEVYIGTDAERNRAKELNELAEFIQSNKRIVATPNELETVGGKNHSLFQFIIDKMKPRVGILREDNTSLKEGERLFFTDKGGNICMVFINWGVLKGTTLPEFHLKIRAYLESLGFEIQPSEGPNDANEFNRMLADIAESRDEAEKARKTEKDDKNFKF